MKLIRIVRFSNIIGVPFIHATLWTYNCLWFKSSSAILREENRFRLFENRVLRKIFGLKRDEVSGEWRRLYNEELYDLYFSLNIIWVKNKELRYERGM